jgi:hypothetical protein
MAGNPLAKSLCSSYGSEPYWIAIHQSNALSIPPPQPLRLTRPFTSIFFSPIHEAAEKIWKNIEDTGHALLNDPDAPFKVYEMAALSLGLKPTGKP